MYIYVYILYVIKLLDGERMYDVNQKDFCLHTVTVVNIYSIHECIYIYTHMYIHIHVYMLYTITCCVTY